MTPPNRGRISAVVDGDEVTIWNAVQVEEGHIIPAGGSYDTITNWWAGEDGSIHNPDYVTARIAGLMWGEFGIDLYDDDDVNVVDFEDVAPDADYGPDEVELI